MSKGDAPEHPFQEEWTVWEHHESTRKGPDTSYLQNMKELYSFKTVEQFWRFWNNYPKPSELFFDGRTKKKVTRQGESEGKCVEALSIFKKGIKPEWEDALNKIGGEWTLRKIVDATSLDQLFENVLLAMVGETLDDGDDVNGMRVVDKSKRRTCAYRIELWVKTNDSARAETIKTNLTRATYDGVSTATPRATYVWRPHKTE